MPSSVDFPAPLGPSRPRISPECSDRETRETALRRPKCQDSSLSSTRSKSKVTGGSGGDTRAAGRLRTRIVVFERAVNVLERLKQFLTTCRVPQSVDLAAPMVVFQPHQILEQLLASGDQALA